MFRGDTNHGVVVLIDCNNNSVSKKENTVANTEKK